MNVPFHLLLKLYLSRFSKKIDQLRQFGLIDHWIETEQDKVARLAKIGKLLQKIFILILQSKSTFYSFHEGESSVDFKSLSISNLQVTPGVFYDL